MEKKLVLLTALVLSAVLTSPIYAASPKAGASCTKAGTSAIYAGKKYTCIKSGKKLVWGKGMVVPAPKPSATPTTSPSPMPTPTASAIPTPSPTPTVPSSPITLDNLDISRVSQLAYSNVLKDYEALVKKIAPITFYVDPSVSNLWIAEEQSRLNRIYTFLQTSFLPQSVNALYWIDSNDSTIQWAQSKYNSWNSGIIHDFQSDKSGPPCGNAYAVAWPEVTGNSNIDRWGYVSCSGEVTSDKAFKPIHEYFHLFQADNHFVGPNSVEWLVEGSSDFYGQMLGLNYENPSNLLQHRKMMTNWVSESKHLTQEQFITLMQKMETSEWNHASYYLGSLATEALVAVFGNNQFLSFVKDWKDLPDCRKQCQTTPNNFAARFEKYFGITPLKFYEKLYPYYVGMNEYYLKN